MYPCTCILFPCIHYIYMHITRIYTCILNSTDRVAGYGMVWREKKVIGCMRGCICIYMMLVHDY